MSQQKTESPDEELKISHIVGRNELGLNDTQMPWTQSDSGSDLEQQHVRQPALLQTRLTQETAFK